MGSSYAFAGPPAADEPFPEGDYGGIESLAVMGDGHV